MQEGTFELSALIIIFLGLQAWWIIPIIKTNSLLNIKRKKFARWNQSIRKALQKMNLFSFESETKPSFNKLRIRLTKPINYETFNSSINDFDRHYLWVWIVLDNLALNQ